MNPGRRRAPNHATQARDVRPILETLRERADSSRLPGMARYGIETERALGVSVPELRALAREIGTDHQLAGALWASGVHEARLLATMIDAADLVTLEQMESWILDVRSWDLCDQLCLNLFDRTPDAFGMAMAWSGREEEFVKRAGFALMACAAVHRKDVQDEPFVTFLPVILAQATDERNYVKKAVSWALRQIGKRSRSLHRAAVSTAERIARLDSRAARWIASDTLRELGSPNVRTRLGLAGASAAGTAAGRASTRRGARARARGAAPGTGRPRPPR